MLQRLRTLVASAALAAAAFAPEATAQCAGGSTPCHVLGTGDVYDGQGGPFLTGHTYIVQGTVTVPVGQTLTIQPGAIVKTDTSVNFRLTVWGTLRALGTAASPIVFTSYRDDSFGGDHNGDGASTTPAPGDWLWIVLGAGSTNNQIAHCRVRYAGLGGTAAALEVQSPGLVLTDTMVEHCLGPALNCDKLPALVQNCAFDHCKLPVTGATANGLPVFVNNTATGNVQGDSLRVDGTQGATITQNKTWGLLNTLNGDGVLLMQWFVAVPANVTLTIDPGIIVKWTTSGGGMNVQGTVHAPGTVADPIVFTTVADDAFGGDSWKDGPTTGSPGAWKELTFQDGADATLLQNVIVRHGGSGPQGSVVLQNADVTLQGCTFAQSGSRGLHIGTSKPVVSGCAFADNATTAIDQVGLDALAGFSNNTAAGNGQGDYVTLGGGVLGQAFTLGPQSAFNGSGTFAVTATLTIGAAGSLTIAPGVILKMVPGAAVRWSVDGVLTADGSGGQIVFTSLADDTHGGDTNADGAASAPATGDWRGLSFGSGADASLLRNVRVRFAGASGDPAIDLSQTDLTLDGVTIGPCAAAGLDASGASAPTVTGCAFDGCQGAGGPIVALALQHAAGFTNNTAQNNAGGDALRFGASSLTAPAALTPVNSLNGTGVFVLAGDVQVTASGSLTVAAGCVLKAAGARLIDAAGALLCQGTPQQPVVFTALADDSVGGDTANDGATTGSPGDWRQLRIANHDTSQLAHTRVRFAGNQDVPSLALVGADALLDQVTVEHGKAAALDLFSSEPTVQGCAFDHCLTPVVGASLAALVGFSGNTAQGNAQGDVLRIASPGVAATPPIVVTKGQSLNGTGVFLITGNLNTGSNQAIQIQAGVIFKWTGPLRFFLNGPLTCTGTAASPVVFTSVNDDTFGGDSTKNGPVPPLPGDWGGLTFTTLATPSVLTHVRIRYAGAGNQPAVDLNSANITMQNVVIEQSLGPALDTNGNSSPVLDHVSFLDNGGVPVDGITWGLLGNMTAVVASGNGGGDSTVIDSPVVEGDLMIEQGSYFGACIVVNVTPAPSVNSSLSFGRGVCVKAGNPTIRMPVKNLLGTGLEKVVFTSIHDDSVGGDTNGNGTATGPTPGDWIGVTAALAEHAIVRYAGGGTDVDKAGLTCGAVRGCRVEFAAGDGILGHLGGTVEDCIAFQNLGRGIVAFKAISCTMALNQGTGFYGHRAAYCIAWLNGMGGIDNYWYTPDMVLGSPNGEVVYSCGTSLTIGPGTGFNGNCGSTGFGNLNADPRFVDLQNGDLRLKADSPCRNYPIAPITPGVFGNPLICTPWGNSGQGYPEPAPALRDYLEQPRPTDDDLAGPAPLQADLGARERALYTLALQGETRIGGSFTLTVGGPAGVATYLLGVDGPGAVLPGYGVLLLNPNVFLILIALPVGTPLTLPVPDLPGMQGLTASFQGLGQATAGGTSLTNVFRARFY